MKCIYDECQYFWNRCSLDCLCDDGSCYLEERIEELEDALEAIESKQPVTEERSGEA